MERPHLAVTAHPSSPPPLEETLSSTVVFVKRSAGRWCSCLDPKQKTVGLQHICNTSVSSSFIHNLQTFRREGKDLHMNHKIGLVEALCGFQFMLKHLDGRQIVVKYPAGKVIEPG